MNPGLQSALRAMALRMGNQAPQPMPGPAPMPPMPEPSASPNWGGMFGRLMAMRGNPGRPGDTGGNMSGLQGGLGNVAGQLQPPTMLPGTMGLGSMSY